MKFSKRLFIFLFIVQSLLLIDIMYGFITRPYSLIFYALDFLTTIILVNSLVSLIKILFKCGLTLLGGEYLRFQIIIQAISFALCFTPYLTMLLIFTAIGISLSLTLYLFRKKLIIFKFD